MITATINLIKIAFLLGFLIIIHEGGHFLVAKLCKVKVNEFAIGFGPILLQKQGRETKYVLRLIPLGGFVSMEGEEERSDNEGSFSKASISKRIAIVLAGALVNIIFGLLVYFIIIASYTDISNALEALKLFGVSILDSLKMLVNGTAFKEEQLTGIVGISEIVVQTKGIINYIYLISVISVSLGVTNLLPIPPLDGGKIVLLLIEGIRKKPLKENLEIQIQMAGFALMIALTIFVTYKDIVRII